VVEGEEGMAVSVVLSVEMGRQRYDVEWWQWVELDAPVLRGMARCHDNIGKDRRTRGSSPEVTQDGGVAGFGR
jgi:hypothetical protein